jgi:acetyl-CoA carboxylase biotin carboxylase subunit
MGIKKILVANRGEIAIRIMKGAKELGIKTVAIYSEADKEALHIRFADESVLIGEAPPIKSYLNMDKILSLALKLKVDAIHPGYGFLSENSIFAEKCETAGITFIGPNSTALALVGNKIEARETVKKVGVPLIPGVSEVKKGELLKIAKKIGYPIMIKASMGGGGKGMHIVEKESELLWTIEKSKRESYSSFGDETIYLEKYIKNARHIEFQVLADKHGNVIHLFERECSIQRRHQKIIEETPSVVLDEELRERMGETAKKVIKACKYTNAGTVEFLLDEDKNFYFLEVNARIQVEHPITEMTTGVDIVKEQILIAEGEKIRFKQEEISQKGHAIEARIYAEDAENNFLPSPGKIYYAHEPHSPGIRIDSGIYSGGNVPPHYDPILAKLIAWGENRESARRRLIEALKNYVILGIKTPIKYLIDILEHPKFREGKTYTNFIEKEMKNWTPQEEELKIALIGAIVSGVEKEEKKIEVKEEITSSPWKELGRWELGGK